MIENVTLRAINQVIATLAIFDKEVLVEQLLSDLKVKKPMFFDQYVPTLKLLSRLNVVECSGIHTKLADSYISADEDYRSEMLRTSVAQALKGSDLLQVFCESIQWHEDAKSLVVDAIAINWNLRYLKSLFLDLKILSRSSIHDRYWIIDAEFQKYFKEEVIARNAASINQNGVKPAQIEIANRKKIEAGNIAEEWILDWEQTRLRSHPLKNQIKRLSLIDASAGFDIISFSSETVLRYDRFIEVKSYAENCNFFWSQNEVLKAKRLGDQYLLVLVDRTQLEKSNYTPKFLKNPYEKLFLQQSRAWIISTDTYHIKSV